MDDYVVKPGTTIGPDAFRMEVRWEDVRFTSPAFDNMPPQFCGNLMIHRGAEGVAACKRASPAEIKFFMRAIRSGLNPIHYQHGVNTPACVMGGDAVLIDVAGDFIIIDRTLVNCKSCIEWLHA